MPRKILIVEDEQEIREAIAEELADSGYETTEATDGADALEKIQAEVPDLILSDISMPKMDGLEMLGRLRADFPKLADTPFVFLTAYYDRERQIAARKAGADEFIQKPVDFELLREVVENQMRKMESAHRSEARKLVKLYKKLQPGDGPTGSEMVDGTPKGGGDTRQIWHEDPAATARGAEISDRLGGRLALVGLQSIKSELGTQWGAFATQIVAIAENVICQNLSAGDRYHRKDAETFELCFESADDGKIEAIVEQIKLKVRQAISTAHSEGDFEQYCVSRNQVSRASRVKAQLYEIGVPNDAAMNDSDLMQIVSGAIANAASEMARNASDMVLSLVRNAEVEPMIIFTSTRKRSGRVHLDFDTDHRAIVRKLRNALSEDKKTMLDLDLARVGLASRFAIEHAYEDKNLLLVPINASTILDKHASQKFFFTCSGMPNAVRSALGFVIENDVEVTHPNILSDAIRSTKPICKESSLRIHDLTALPPQLNASVISSVALSYFDYETSLEEDSSELQRFKQSVKKNKIKVLADSLTKKRHVDNIASLKPDYLCFAKP